MCGTEVRKSASTPSRPRSSAASPAAARFSWSVAPVRPAEKSTRSETIRFPDSRNSTPRRGGPSDTSNRSTVSPKRKVTLRFRIWWMSSSTISRSTNSSTPVAPLDHA